MTTYADPGEEHMMSVPLTGHIAGQHPPHLIGSAAANAFSEVSKSPADWWALPITLRRQWWRETNLGTANPSPELKEKVRVALAADTVASPTVTPPET